MRIFVRISTGKQITLDVQRLDSIKDVKAIIHGKEGILPDAQWFIYAEKHLKDSDTLFDYDISEEFTLHLVLRLQGDIPIFVQDAMTGNIITVDYSKDMKVVELKRVIETTMGIPTAKQRLVCNSKPLEDGKTLGDYHIVKEALIYMIPVVQDGMHIVVKAITGKTVTVDCNKEMKVIELKQVIEAEMGLPLAQQRLLFIGKILDDRNRLGDYEIINESLIFLVPVLLGSIQIVIKQLTGETRRLKCAHKMTVAEVKQMIEKAVHIPVKEQRLIYSGINLEDSKTLDDYDIPNEATLFLIYPAPSGPSQVASSSVSLQVIVKPPSGKTLTIATEPNQTVASLKVRIKELEGFTIE